MKFKLNQLESENRHLKSDLKKRIEKQLNEIDAGDLVVGLGKIHETDADGINNLNQQLQLIRQVNYCPVLSTSLFLDVFSKERDNAMQMLHQSLNHISKLEKDIEVIKKID